MGSTALCGIKSSASQDGDDRGAVEMVERGGALRESGRGRDAGDGAVVEAVDYGRVGAVSGGGRVGIGGQCSAAVYAHGASARRDGVCGGTGTNDVASACAAKGRSAEETNRRHAANECQFRGVMENR